MHSFRLGLEAFFEIGGVVGCRSDRGPHGT